MKKTFLISLITAFALLNMWSCSNNNEGSALTIYGGHTSTSVTGEDAVTAGSPTSMKFSMYAAWVCANADCTSCTEVTNYGSTAQEKNTFDERPIFFEGNPTAGTYNCIIIKLNDTMKFIPDAAAATAFADCVEGREYTYDVYRAEEAEGVPAADRNTWVDKDKNIITSTGSVSTPGTDIIYLFATTDPSALVGVSSYQTVELSAPLVVPGQTTMVADFTNKVSDSQNHCWLEGFQISFE